MDFEKIFTIVLLVLTILLSIYVYSEMSKTSKPPSPGGSPFIPFSQGKKKMCSTEKVSCDPSNKDSCKICGDTEEMMCISPNKDGEYVCLPSGPNIDCNEKNGGKYIWTGYGFTQKKDWQCLCTRPEIYNGPNCDIKNPSYCNGGQVTDIKSTLKDICKCPDGTSLLFRINNTPMCVSDIPEGGGGYKGLYGNFVKKPNWENVYLMTTNIPDWANDICREFNYPQGDAVLKILNEYNPTPLTLTTEIVEKLQKLDPVFSSVNFDPNYDVIVPYRYFPKTYLP